MKVGLVGFGKTGKAVASILLESKTTHLSWVLRRSKALEHRSVPEFLGVESEEPGMILSAGEFSARGLLDAYPVDVIVDFSAPDGIDYYGDEARKRGICIISAVSEYPAAALDRLRQLAKGTKVIYSPNITLGINFLLIAAKILKNIAPSTDIEIIEEHYKKKPEVSGTARIIAKHLDIEESAIKTVRAGGIIGTHEILFGFPYQTVRLKHESISREAFGSGILFVLKHLPSRKTGLYSMEDLMIPYFQLGKSERDFSRSKTKPWWKIW
ncbi:MAG: dihydrodipicolinate reductase C-terminal domain-containing protein [Sulfuritalea sp.]|nr:dihydrodipicolinate reductase C-terminal domain-containing protein [Sulfuritalea sp.]